VRHTSLKSRFGKNDRLKKIEEKSGGRNDKHANPDTKASAEQKYEEARAAWQKLKSKPNKTPAEKQLQQQLEKQVKHWKKKKDWGGENHSQKHKGS
jgi:hypothetical protein